MIKTITKKIVLAGLLAVGACVPTTNNGMMQLPKTIFQVPYAKFLSTCAKLNGSEQKNKLTMGPNPFFKTTKLDSQQSTMGKKIINFEQYDGQKSRFKTSFKKTVFSGLCVTGIFAAIYYLVKRQNKKMAKKYADNTEFYGEFEDLEEEEEEEEEQ
ncbi:MAG: hypothetical protein M1549_03910 [Candidatus Dependentiae bacterium]|nr:hypothetical protein [Candidatus Dependentiae bacterium]